MSFFLSSRIGPGGLVAAAALTVSSLAHADVPSATWSALRGRDVIVETESGKVIGGKLLDVQASTVAVLAPGGETLQISRESVRSARAVTSDAVPAYGSEVSPRPLAPGVLEWKEGDPIPPGFHKDWEVRTGLVIGGSVTFGTAWVGSMIGAAGLGYPVLAIPVAGPLITAGLSFRGGSMNATFGILFLADGIQQAVGLSILIYGLATSKTVLRSNYRVVKPWWVPAPVVVGSGMGIGISGRM
jgi:hypothetical protein